MVDYTAPPATETQQQNGSPASDATASSARTAPGVPPTGAVDGGQPTPAAPWSYPVPEEAAGASRTRLLGGLGGALLLAAGIGGLIFARRRRHVSRRAQAMQAARESALSAVATAGSLGVFSQLRRGLARVIAGRAALESAMEQHSKRAGRMAKQARKKMPR